MRSLLFSLSLLTIPSASANSNWLQFRGDTSGIASGDLPPARFEKNKSIQWKAILPGRGLSSPLIVNGRVILTAASGPKQEELHILCFNEKDGNPLWDRSFRATGRTMCHEKTCNAAPTPCSDGSHIVALYSSNDLICLDLEGNLKWLRGLTVDYPNASNSLGLASSPVIADGVLIAQIENDSESFTAGIDMKTGVNLWKRLGAKDANWSSPAIIRETGQPSTVVILSDQGAAGLDPQSGKERWHLPKPGSTIPSCSASATHLAVPRGRGMSVWELKGGTTPPNMLWESAQVGADTSTPLLIGARLFSISGAGVMTAAEIKNGERAWKLRMEGKFSGSPVAAGNTVYVASEQGVLMAIDTTAPEGAVSGTLALGETVLCTPSIASGAVFLRSDASLWKIGASR